MHTSRLLLRSGLTLAAAAALPAALAEPSAAVSGISVSTTGSTVSVVTSACTQINGSWGNAALLTSRQANFAEGRQVALSGTTISQSAAWSKVSPGTYTVVVVCSSGSTAGTQSVIVSAPTSPTISATSSPAPSRGVMGGLGGAARDYGPLTLGIGAALVGTGVIATGWYLRKRSKPYRL
ncbi:hypothetical protein LK07_31510 [Streptomyces pluripotens]|uniref:Secreted protein n=1 Tax=Streptomyces pluripotens TaxID=1355015 RepID=A0A221P9D6_9ACTN|nr:MULTISPECIES: hypothetical protein [Streptomyces]ARP74555.1 hypothetical protein LK06_030320 [Streptomyces pluripotens]ASN28830.1 hypothetical protein LK07_31510 [Streptomyces pluripotens]KIE26947.1 hypothetical protein LK08_11085 [Streptomyces sp. MUSC 125]MCH0557270.1 hypothetical protein [Streptomyces sp. MUM 16J]